MYFSFFFPQMRNLTNEHKALHQEIPSKFQKQQFFFTFVGKMRKNSLKDRKIELAQYCVVI